MSRRSPILSAANLLAYLEATSLGLVDVTEEERKRASRIAARVTRAESRRWRAHRRPSPGKGKIMRGAGLSIAFLLLVPSLFVLPREVGVFPVEARSGDESGIDGAGQGWLCKEEVDGTSGID